jgi:hypothetical protein
MSWQDVELKYILEIDEKYIDAFPKKMKEAIKIGIREIARFIRDQWRENVHNFGLEVSGTAYHSIRFRKINDFKYKIFSDDTAPYLKYHEWGAGVSHEPDPHDPFFPPPDKIRQWIEAKGVYAYDANGRLINSKRLAFLISRSIFKRGLYPKPCFRPAVASGERVFRQYINDAIAEYYGLKK